MSNIVRHGRGQLTDQARVATTERTEQRVRAPHELSSSRTSSSPRSFAWRRIRGRTAMYRFARRPAAVGARGLFAVVLALTAFAIAPAAGHASAVGYQYWNAFTWNGITIPGGQLTHVINGSGNHVRWHGANFAAVGNLCDSSVKFTYGNRSYALYSRIRYGCSRFGQWKYYRNRRVATGSACAELWAHRWRKFITQQCHYVRP